MVDMVAAHAGRNVNDQIVHLQVLARSVLAVGQRVHGVPGTHTFVGVPFVLAKAMIIFRIDDSEFSLRQRNPAKGVAVPKPPIKKYK